MMVPPIDLLIFAMLIAISVREPSLFIRTTKVFSLHGETVFARRAGVIFFRSTPMTLFLKVASKRYAM